jgi:hypothetical protein
VAPVSCLFCGEAIDRDNQPWRIIDVIQPSPRPAWEPEVRPPDPEDRDYMERLGEIDGYPVHLACLRRVIAAEQREQPIFRQPSR